MLAMESVSLDWFRRKAEETLFAVTWDAFDLPHPTRFCTGIINVCPISPYSHVNQLEPQVDLKVESAILFMVFFSILLVCVSPSPNELQQAIPQK